MYTPDRPSAELDCHSAVSTQLRIRDTTMCRLLNLSSITHTHSHSLTLWGHTYTQLSMPWLSPAAVTATVATCAQWSSLSVGNTTGFAVQPRNLSNRPIAKNRTVHGASCCNCHPAAPMSAGTGIAFGTAPGHRVGAPGCQYDRMFSQTNHTVSPISSASSLAKTAPVSDTYVAG
jgi:hypothetical protein